MLHHIKQILITVLSYTKRTGIINNDKVGCSTQLTSRCIKNIAYGFAATVIHRGSFVICNNIKQGQLKNNKKKWKLYGTTNGNLE